MGRVDPTRTSLNPSLTKRAWGEEPRFGFLLLFGMQARPRLRARFQRLADLAEDLFARERLVHQLDIAGNLLVG